MSTLEQILEAALELSLEEQEALLDAMQKHKSKILRVELAEYSQQSRLDVQSGKLKPKSVAEIMSQLDESMGDSDA
jgi:flagellar motility protein MotE (MotC chaperone)